MDKEARELVNQMVRQLYAMANKKKASDLVTIMRNERYQRTFTDEYLFKKKSRGRASVPADVQEGWKKLKGLP